MCCGALLQTLLLSLETALHDASLTFGCISQLQKLQFQQLLKCQQSILAAFQYIEPRLCRRYHIPVAPLALDLWVD
jgi:hypothetical protein